ncbi:MAG: hypothetical protein MN733_00045, partial [Nitrososphaera sp.]|nr:hypothetical protein [Nitrososphaera sp.]
MEEERICYNAKKPRRILSFFTFALRSAGRIRTYNPPVTVVHRFRDGLDYLFILFGIQKRSRALMGLIGENPHPLVSARFPLRMFSSRNFAQDYHISYRNVGFPEFTRCFTPDYSGELQEFTAGCSTI